MDGVVVGDWFDGLILWAVIVVGLGFVIAYLFAMFLGARWVVRRIWRNVSRPEFVALAVWGIAVFALSLAATLIIVHRALALPRSAEPSDHFFLTWAVTWGGSLLLVSILGGLFVFRPSTPWREVLTWPWLVGGAVGLAYMMGLSGHMDGGSKLCDAPAGGSCDTAWGLGAILLTLVAAVVLGGTFVMTATMRRLLPRLLLRRS